MKLPPILTLSVLIAAASMAAAAPAPTLTVSMENEPAPDLVRLERILTQKLEARDKGQVTPEAFSEFVRQFRVDLIETDTRIPPSPANTGLHARILARLQEPGEAMARLDEALLQEPDNSTLLNARGYVQFQQGDYLGALASANQVLKYNQDHGQSDDKGALALKYSSEGRIAGKTPTTQALSPIAPQSQGIDGLDDPGKPYKLAVKASAKSGEVPAVMTGENEPLPARGHTPLLPVLIVTGAGFTAYGFYKVSKSNSTASANDGLNPAPDVSPEQVRRNYLNSAVLIGTPILALGLVYGGPAVLRVAAPVVTNLAQRLQGSPLPAVAAGNGEALTKVSARVALQGMTLPPNQLQAASRAIQRATLSDTIKMSVQKGGDLILKVSRPGRDGFQEFEHTISPNGTKQVIQRAYNSAGQLVHFDPKTQ
ncbi:MAG: hypothetical protein HYV14_11670 [Elusimicrobia bacterium]|nr:hypothetical protein [Elusimicrobiota bacterium]